MEIRNITSQIVQIHCPTKLELGLMFCRFEEHYESPEFKGKIFTLGQFREWYSKNHGAWTYYDDWAGFNLPGYIFKPFKKGLFDPLTKEEQILLDLFKHRNDNFYVIGTSGDCYSEEDVVLHEIMHALFYLNHDYRGEIIRAMKPYDFKPLIKHLKSLGYCDDVLVDECHAYVGASGGYLDAMKIEYPKNLTSRLRSIKEKYLK